MTQKGREGLIRERGGEGEGLIAFTVTTRPLQVVLKDRWTVGESTQSVMLLLESK